MTPLDKFNTASALADRLWRMAEREGHKPMAQAAFREAHYAKQRAFARLKKENENGAIPTYG